MSKSKRLKVEEAGLSSNGGVFQFDVFLSFRGTDARQGFTSHLYKELNQLGVITFIDREDFQKGERISQLFHYMESSQIFVPILSKNYAQSKWCLLEAAKMVEIAEGAQLKMRRIIPLFYHVDPSDVKDDRGLYQSAAKELQNSGKLEGRKVKECIDALKTIGSISGFHLKMGTDGNEAELIGCICRDVEKLLGRVPFAVQPIGIDSQIDEVITMLEAQANGVCIVGICGMGGIGKTTIAKAIYDKLLFSEFDGSSFIEDIREFAADRKGLLSVQQMLICDVLKIESVSIRTVEEGCNTIKRKIGRKRVLLILDNVDKLDQLNALLGDGIRNKPDDLFGGGSKIVVTTRDEAILLSYGMKKRQIYHPRELKTPWSLKLFHQHAFKHGPPSFVLLDLAKEVAGIAGGLPLVLVTVGSVFAGLLTQEEWEGELKKIRKNRGTSIVEKLKWSYDGLDNDQKCVFLDIACFLVGAKKKRATYLWDDRSPENAIRVLQERNLLSIDDEDRFRMHDQIQEMGRWIVSSEGNLGPYMNRRFCYSNEESIMSMNSQEKGKVEGIVLNMEVECTETSLTTKVFVDMPKLRLLHLNFVNFLEPKIDHFPRRLKWLQWRGCKLESVTFDRTSLKNLAILDLSQSSIDKLTLKNELDRLKVLDLSNCYIEATPDFAWTPKLEQLFLDDCVIGSEVHESICCLENLTTLSMRNCKVKELPEKHQRSIANLSKLEELNLQGCQQLQSLPRLPSSLKTLILQGCKMLKPVHGFQNLESMELLDIDGCENINFTLMSTLFKGKTFKHLKELSASANKTLSEDEKFSFIVPLDSPSNPLLLQRLQCYGDGSKYGNLSNIYIKFCVKDMEDNLVIYETIFSGYRDIDNEIDGQYGWCYTVSFSKYDDINFFPELYRPCSICVSTADNFPLISVHILLRSACRWSRNYSKVIPIGKNVTNSRTISAQQNQPLPLMFSAEYFTFEFDVLFRYVKEDIDTKFINNLYKALQQHGINMFKGEDAEKKGREYFLNCIERSAICIPIFSKHFSQSKWHLNSVAKMVELGKFIIPIYFQVPPSDIRDRKGVFGTYFSCHENEDQREIVEDWIKALKVVVKQCHQEFIYETNRYMEELIAIICSRISSMLNSATFRKMPTWLGVNDVIRMLEKDQDDDCRVGICGQSGMGKTTIAKAIYEQLSHEFVGSAFIPCVPAFEERKWQFLGQRVLIVFDDVDRLNKFESRQIFNRDFFGRKSKIIFIAKDKKDLIYYGVKEDNIYFAHELNNMQSLRLLGYYAFKGKQPTAEIVELARKVTEFAGGLPLGLAVLGSLLSSMRTKEEWESMLEKLSCAPGEGFDRVLKLNMNALHPNQLQIFFDVACRLIGREKEYATYMWEDCGYSPTDAIKVLRERSLISIDEEGKFRMQEKIRDTCRSIVEKGELKIWIENGLLVDLPDWEDWRIEGLHSFFSWDLRSIPIEAMGNLRVLHLRDCIVDHNSLQSLKNLRWLRMEMCDVDSWIVKDGSIFGKLLVLQLHNCHNSMLGKQDVASAGNKHEEVFKKLKVLEIIRCSDVGMASRDFSLMPSLVKLVTKYSWNFDHIPKSIWRLRKLEYLRITGAKMKVLSSNTSNMSSLQILDLGGCRLLSKLPEGLGDLTALRELLLRNCHSLKEIPSSVVKLNHLMTLIASGCRSLHRLPQLPSSLITLDASGCTNLRQVADISNLKDLRTLNLDRCDVLQDVPGLQNLNP